MLYGVGVMVGAGIYVLVGKVAGIANNGVWISLLLAAAAALPTGLAYAELSSRHPRSAGEAVFVERAGGAQVLSFLVGYLILASGVASVAAVSHGFADYLSALLGIDDADPLLIVAFLVVLTLINHLGIEESTWVNVTCTVVSVGALIAISIAGASTWGAVDLLDVDVEGSDAGAVGAVIAGSALSFYAYIGFEDICNVAEEVRHPERTIPRAIISSVAITAVLYALVGITVVSAVPASTLAASDVPLAVVWERVLPGVSVHWLELVALFAVTNTALFNLIMASRIVYGMAQAGLVPATFGHVHAKRRSPTAGVLLAFALALTVALTGVLQVLAEATAAIILVAFFAVNLSLIVIRKKGVPADDPKKAHFEVPLFVPIVGMAIVAYMVVQFSLGAYLRFGALVAFGALLYALARRGRISTDET